MTDLFNRSFFTIIFAIGLAGAAVPDSASMADNAQFLDEHFGISKVTFSQSILKELQGTYTSTLFYDSIYKEVDTSFVMNVSDTFVETKSLINKIVRTEKTAFFAKGTDTESGSEIFITYSEDNVFLILTKTSGSDTRYGEYSLLILYQDSFGPATMNFILRKAKA
jgi:hypothetical protein